MPFSHNSYNAPPTNTEVKEEKQRLIQHISDLHAQYQALEDKSAELKRTESLLVEMRQAYAQAQVDFDILNDKISNLKKQMINLTDKNSALENDLSIRDVSIREGNKKLIELSGKENIIQQNISDLENVLEKLNIQQITAKQNVLSTLKSLEESKRSFEEYQEKNTIRISEYTGILAELSNKIEAKKSEEREVARRLKDENMKISEAYQTLESIKQQNKVLLSTAQEQAKKIIIDAEEIAISRKQDLDNREGIISEREVWQADKQKRLIEAKAELEKIHNRKISIQI